MQPVLQTSKLDEKLVASLERAFAHHAGGQATIGAAELQKALGLRGEYLARRVLAQFDKNGDGVVNCAEFLSGVRRLVFGSNREKLEFAFRLWDHDGDGSIDQSEIHRMIAMSLAEADVQTRGTQSPDSLARALMRAADRDRNGRITFDEFEAVLSKRPEILRAMTRSEALWIAPNEDLLARFDDERTKTDRAGRVVRFVQNTWRSMLLVALWGAANVAVFVLAMFANRSGSGTNEWMQVGRACGRCMDLDGALILVPVMRRLLTRVRASWLGRVIPVDEALGFHRLVGHALAAFAAVHTAAFVVAYAQGHGTQRLAAFFASNLRGLTGAALVVVFAVMWVFALSPVRRSRRFELFYFTHLLYVVWFALALVHAPAFGFWVGVPLLGFAIEQVQRRRRRGATTVAVSAESLRSGVTRLEIERPPNFRFEAGDYVFVRIPAIARHEWHPFTISSPPERETITLHVRSLGNWTSALRRWVEEREAGASEGPLVVHVDGPFGSPTAHIFRSKFAVFIGAGIGVTPFASVLESLALRLGSDNPPALKKGHFFWLNRDQYSFEWFTAMLAEVERIDRHRLIDMHLCMTGGRADVTSVGLEIAREVTLAAGAEDVVTGLRAKTHMGQPDWDSMLGEIAQQHAPETVDVFFCGPPGLAVKVRRACEHVGMTFREEQF